MIKRTTILLVLLGAAAPAARAQIPERKSPLADAPAVRHRFELRQNRFEIGAGVMTTVGQDFYHAVLVGGKMSYHITDWLALGAMGGFNVTPNLTTSFHDELLPVLPEQRSGDRTPSKQDALAGMNKICQVFGAHLEIVPFTGKYSLFGKLFASYDFYAFGGPGFINCVSDGAACAMDGPSCPVVGMKIGANFGVGMHTFVNDYLAINLEVRDILLRNNPSGRDVNGDTKANADDMSWDSNYMVGLNFTLFLPSKARISD
jgi:hypothetical protein